MVLSCIFHVKEGIVHATGPSRGEVRRSSGEAAMIRLMLMSVFLGSVGQIMMKSGSDRLGNLTLSPSTLLSDLLRILRIPEFGMALLLFGVSSLIWMKVLSKNELTHAYPLGSMSYVFVMVLSALLLHETLTVSKVLGALVIVSGIFIMHR